MLSEQEIRQILHQAEHELPDARQRLRQINGRSTADEIQQAGDHVFKLQITIDLLRQILEEDTP